jgi:hypothetical protein
VHRNPFESAAEAVTDDSGFTDEAKARGLLKAKVDELRAFGYEELRKRLGRVQHSLFGGRFEISAGGAPWEARAALGGSGTRYEIEIITDEDIDEDDAVDVTVMVRENPGAGGELVDGFIMRPDGSTDE